MFQRILTAINHDDTSLIVFDEAVTLAKQSGAALMLVHVLSSELKGQSTKNGAIGKNPAKPDVIVAANGGSDLI